MTLMENRSCRSGINEPLPSARDAASVRGKQNPSIRKQKSPRYIVFIINRPRPYKLIYVAADQQ